MDIAQLADRLTAETAKIIYGKETQIRLIVMALLSQGHVLLEDLPGVGKTTLIKTLAAVSGCRSKRIQFVPDLLPADILGMNIYDRNRGEFRHLPGPVFTNLLLADEIIRTSDAPISSSSRFSSLANRSCFFVLGQVSYASSDCVSYDTYFKKRSTAVVMKNHPLFLLNPGSAVPDNGLIYPGGF